MIAAGKLVFFVCVVVPLVAIHETCRELFIAWRAR